MLEEKVTLDIEGIDRLYLNAYQPMLQTGGGDEEAYSRGRMTYDLRRLRLRGIIAREDGTNRYHVTHEGMRICLFMTKVHLRIIRPGCSQLMNGCPKAAGKVIAAAMNQLDKAIDQMIMEAKIVA